MSEMKLLVVDNDAKRAERLCAILKFLGNHQISVSDFGQWNSSDGFDGLFINANGIGKEIARVEESDMQAPVFCYGDAGSIPPAPVLLLVMLAVWN